MKLITKIKKYLLRHEQINVYKKNESGSEYFQVGNSIIRVSDHIATSRNDPDVLNIIVYENDFIILYGNKIININDYNSFKSFLKYHIQMCDCFKNLINKGLGRVSKNDMEDPVNYSSPYIKYNGEIFDLTGVSPKKIKGVHKMLESGSFPKRKSLVKHLQKDCKLNIQ